jgi:hypothetical protein
LNYTACLTTYNYPQGLSVRRGLFFTSNGLPEAGETPALPGKAYNRERQFIPTGRNLTMKRFWHPWGIILVTMLVSILTPGMFCIIVKYLSYLIESLQRYRLAPSFNLLIQYSFESYSAFIQLATIPAILFSLYLQRKNQNPLRFLRSLSSTAFIALAISLLAYIIWPVGYAFWPETVYSVREEWIIPSILFGLLMGALVNYSLNSRCWTPKVQQEPSPQPPN